MLSFRVFVTLHPCWLVFSLPPFSSTSRSPYALPSSVYRKPCVCHSYENRRGVGIIFPLWKTLGPRLREVSLSFKLFLFTLLRTLLHSPRTQLVCFQTIPHSLRKNTRGWGTLALGSMWARVPRIQGRMMLWL